MKESGASLRVLGGGRRLGIDDRLDDSDPYITACVSV